MSMDPTLIGRRSFIRAAALAMPRESDFSMGILSSTMDARSESRLSQYDVFSLSFFLKFLVDVVLQPIRFQGNG
jgi:hypothetical protein